MELLPSSPNSTNSKLNFDVCSKCFLGSMFYVSHQFLNQKMTRWRATGRGRGQGALFLQE